MLKCKTRQGLFFRVQSGKIPMCLFTHRWADLGAIGATILIGTGFGAIGCKSSATILEIDSCGTTLTGVFREAGPGRGLDKGPGPDC